MGNALSLPAHSGSCQYLDGLERADRACPQLIITSPTSDNDGSYKLDSSEQVKSAFAFKFIPLKAVENASWPYFNYDPKISFEYEIYIFTKM